MAQLTADDARIWKQRLSYKEKELRSCLIAYLDLCSASTNHITKKEDNLRIIELQQWSDFLREFDIYRLALEKTAVSIMVCQQDKSDYEAKLSEIEERIDKVKLSITELKSTLVEDRRIRMQKDEYESIARLIHQLPSRSDTEQVILKLEMEIAELNAVEESLILETTSRQRDFSVLFHSLSALSKDAVPLDEKAAAGETVITQ